MLEIPGLGPAAKRERLEKAGWIFEDAEELLELTEEERQLVELRVALSLAVRDARIRRGLTQAQAAKALKTSQPNVSKIETGTPGASLDVTFRSLFALGGNLHDLLDPAPATRGPAKRKRVATTG